MKITKGKLRQIIKEEVSRLLEYERVVYRRSDGQLRIADDDGNDEPAPDYLEQEYSWLETGESEVLPRRQYGYQDSGRRDRYRWRY